MPEESVSYHSGNSIAWDCYDHGKRSSDVSDNKKDNENLERCRLYAGRVYYRLIQEIVNKLCEAEDSYQDESEYPEAYIQSDSCSAAVFQDDSQDCTKCTSHKRTYIWYYVEDACKKGDSKCCIYTQSRYGP